ncbi:hypothetical protein SLEP1_g40803 [Rubroshorea leprosula]|uniref:BZIP domain-containing protein n=1 Tax=Rubroshorea leprosula TaxID=152421 RepID=A0AAV5L4Q9_9ROSI|nr:hypothetical protein SLEP1_g40803 [Rubroshorea leprosula]
MKELGTYQRQASQTAIGSSDPVRGIGEKSFARGTRFLHSPANTFPFIGSRKLLSSFQGQLFGTKITRPNKRESVGRRVQEASAPSIALGENSEEALRTSDRRERKRRADIKYRVIKKGRQQELEVEYHRLKQEIQEKEKQEQLTKSELEELKAKHVRLKSELEEKNQVIKPSLDVIGVVKQQQMSITNGHKYIHLSKIINFITLMIFVSVSLKLTKIINFNGRNNENH